MSFVYGGTDSASLAGVTATLKQWPSLGGLTVQNQTVPGTDGRVFAGSSMERTAFTFDVIVEGSTVEEVSDRRDNLMGVLDPARGPRDLVLETDSDWTWPDVLVSQEILWDRFTWELGLGLRLRADVVFETQHGAHAVESTPVVRSGTRTASFEVDRGNTTCFPRIEFPSGGTREISITGGRTLVIDDAPSGYTCVVDWFQFDFYLATSDGIRVQSLVPFMNHYERPVLFPGQQVTVTANSSISVEVFPNFRRI